MAILWAERPRRAALTAAFTVLRGALVAASDHVPFSGGARFARVGPQNFFGVPAHVLRLYRHVKGRCSRRSSMMLGFALAAGHDPSRATALTFGFTQVLNGFDFHRGDHTGIARSCSPWRRGSSSRGIGKMNFA
jgi:hypothetical protein